MSGAGVHVANSGAGVSEGSAVVSGAGVHVTGAV